LDVIQVKLKFIKINNDIVLQQLIINASIEKTALVSSHEEGDHLTKGGYPTNVGAVYTPDCFQIGSKSGALSTASLRPYDGAPRLSADLDQVIK
jgi:hypothetical protein